MVKLGEIVFNKKGVKGVIKQIITKSTGYVLVSYENGVSKKEMAFNLVDETGKALRKTPKTYAPKPLSPLEQVIQTLKWVNGITQGDRNSLTYQLWSEKIFAIEDMAKKVNNNFIKDVCQSVDRYLRVSDKQAYCLAKFVLGNDIKL